jgi:hypothetical protein
MKGQMGREFVTKKMIAKEKKKEKLLMVPL